MRRYSELMIKSEDIYLLMSSLLSIGWKSIRPTSINRVIYLSAVLYSFIYPEEENIFQENYRFSICVGGPEDAEIENALDSLESNEVIKRTDQGYELNKDAGFSFPASQANRKKEWFDVIKYIIGMYGEDKIYDFIFRDPEYRESLQSNSLYNLDIGDKNATVKFLNQFKNAFEEHLPSKEDALDDKKYLELYFEYVFGRIMRGEK